MECTELFKNATENMEEQDYLKINRIHSAITNKIGVPFPEIVPLAKRNLAKAVGTRERYNAKRAIKIAEMKVKDYDELYNTLFKYIKDIIDEAVDKGEQNIMPEDIEPESIMNDWKNYFESNKFDQFSPLTIQQGAYKIKSYTVRIKRIAKRRIARVKRFEKGGRGKGIMLARFKPQTLAMSLDKFGIIGDVLNKLIMLPDITTQSSAVYINQLNTMTSKYYNEIDQQFGNNKTNINNGFYTGIEFQTKTGANFKAVGTEMVDGEMHYLAFEEKEDPEGVGYYWDKILKSVPASLIEEDLKQKFYDKLMHELPNDILRGQTRKIVPMINPERNDEKATKDAVTPNGIMRYKKALWKALRKENQKRDRKNPPREPEGIHKTIDKDGNTVLSVHIKRGEGTHANEFKDGAESEIYNTYIMEIQTPNGEFVDFEEFSKEKIFAKYKDIDYIRDVLSNGQESTWVRAENEKYYGKLKDSGNQKGWTNFKLLTKEAYKGYGIETEYGTISEELFTKTPGQLGGIQNASLNDHILSMRRWLGEIKEKADNDFAHNDRLVKQRFEEFKKSKNLQGKTADEIQDIYAEYLMTNNIQQTSWIDNEGNIRSLYSTFTSKTENYFPDMYTTGTAFKMIQDARDRIEQQIRNTPEDTPKYEELIASRKNFIEMQEMMSSTDTSMKRQRQFVEAQKASSFKHRRSWTQAELRRKDEMVLIDYINRLFTTIHRNEAISDMLGTIIKIDKMEGIVPEGLKDLVVNRAMIVFGNPLSKSRGFITGKEGGYQKVADTLNRLPKAFRGGRTWDAETAEKLILFGTTLPTMRYLGADTALGNRTQIMNKVIEYGFSYWREAHKEYSNRKEFWDEVVNNTGVLNILNMFSDIMMHGSTPNLKNMGMITSTAIPTFRLLNIPRILKMSKDDFINNPGNDVDKFLKDMLIHVYEKDTKLKIQEIRSLWTKYQKQMRSSMYELMTPKEKMDVQLTKKLIQKMIPGIAEDQLKAMVSYKLSWWFGRSEGRGGRSLFTFTESEISLRRISAIMDLLVARDKGILGASEGADDVSYYKTPAAVKIARDAVYNTQFGMTPGYLGEGFNGIGRLLWQYKQFPAQQMNHDYQVLRRFHESNNGNIGLGIRRTIGALYNLTHKQDVKSGTADEEGLAMARLILTRTFASLGGSLTSLVPFLGYALRKSGIANTAFRTGRSAENPALGLTFRTIVWFSLMMHGGPDDEEKEKRKKMFSAWEMLILPVLIGSLIRDFRGVSEYLQGEN